MNLAELINSGANISVTVTGKDLAEFAKAVAHEILNETNLEKRFAAAKGYYLQRTEIFARFCEVYFAHLFESNQYLAKEIEIYEYKNNWQYIKKAEFKKIKPTADKLFKLINKTLNK